MSKKSWVLFLTFFALSFQLIDIQAQIITKNIAIDWTEPLIYEQGDDKKVEFLHFHGSISSDVYDAMPSYFECWDAAEYYDHYEINVTDARFERMSGEEVALIPADFQQADVFFQAKTVLEKKKPRTALSFVPVRKNGGSYEKLTSATLRITGKKNAAKREATAKVYAAQSVLKSGNWYKISVTESGVHKVTYSDLVSLGISSNNLSSNNITLFGNGGGMLPEDNGVDRPDDLQEVPIEVHDGGDGIFGQGDYFIFYAKGPHSWGYNAESQRFTHQFNLYDSKSFYFINVEPGIGEGRRVAAGEASTGAPAMTVTTYTAYGFYEVDERNIGEAGRGWFGTLFDGSTSSDYAVALPAAVNGQGRLTVSAASSSLRYATFNVSANGQQLGSVGLASLSGDHLAETAQKDLVLPALTGNVSVHLEYSKPTSSSKGYFDYLEWQVPCDLRMESGQTPFCAPQTVGNGAVRYAISQALQNAKVWDVTDPNAVFAPQTVLSGSTLQFDAEAETLRQYVAFTESSCKTVSLEGKVSNQNLHGTSQVDMVIVTHPDFKSQAERLATFRAQHDGLSVKVVTPQQIYNEFSSGAQDVTAIRDYMRMIYDKSNGTQPSYLLLVGRPSYDYRGIEGDCPLYVPNYQCKSILDESSFRANDDYFALLDSDEGSNCVGMLDLSVGRFPVTTQSQAKIAVDKTIHYATESILGAGTTHCNFGDWKNVATFVADDEDGTTHIGTADAVAQLAGSSNANINLEKIYLDSYRQVTYSSSARYPEVTKDINNRMDKGCLLFTYVGHGGKNGWATERIIELTDISRWSNLYNQPWMITLTCEFGWYDRALTAPAEMVFLNANGGAAGMITTSRVAFTGSNHQYGVNLYSHIFEEVSMRPRTIGEMNRLAKNASGGAGNSLNMIYVMGDPAMRLAMPRYQVVTDSINGVAAASFTDTLRALSRVTIVGHIEDDNGNPLTGFTGSVFPSIFDKKQTNNTLQNDAESGYFEFEVQKNVLFKGNVSVKNGAFRFSFILPKDINYAYGKGKVSYYAHSNAEDASGAYCEATIGGMSDNDIADSKGPDIEVYMNDEKFVNGGIIAPSSTLLIKLKDEYGINTTGNGIGHDLVAILDEGEQTILNNYYEAERDSFNCGTVRYPYDGLALGAHKLKVRAWDILNNVSEQEIEFLVVTDEGLTLEHVLNYPNPFTTHTDFYFEHNRPGVNLDILVTIYTISGKVVRTLESSQCTSGFRSDPITWDGRDDFGDKIGRGTYLYRLKVRTPDGQQAEKIEKIVIL